MSTSPQSQHELLERAQRLAGLSIQNLAELYHQPIPKSLHRAKGFIGQLVESALGVLESNLPEPDFPHLGIELKTLPVSPNGKPLESTYICTAPTPAPFETWKTSRVYAKLAHVLWIPIIAHPILSERRIGMPLLWQPSTAIEHTLQKDWEELSLMLKLGETDNLSAKLGTYLQLRPKAAHSRVVNASVNEHSEEVLINPKGFYLRTVLTQRILQEHYCV